MDAVIISGGKGKRMESHLPKALVSVNGKPIIDYQLKYLESKVDRIVLALGYKGNLVQRYVSKNYPNAKVKYSHENPDKPLGTAGALKKTIKKIDSEYVLVLNGDDITDIDVGELESKVRNTNRSAICGVSEIRMPFGLMQEVSGNLIFKEKPIWDLGSNFISCGWYCFRKRDLKTWLPEVGMLETHVFPKMEPAPKIYHHKGFWHSLNSPKQVDEFEKMIKAEKSVPEIYTLVQDNPEYEKFLRSLNGEENAEAVEVALSRETKLGVGGTA